MYKWANGCSHANEKPPPKGEASRLGEGFQPSRNGDRRSQAVDSQGKPMIGLGGALRRDPRRAQWTLPRKRKASRKKGRLLVSYPRFQFMAVICSSASSSPLWSHGTCAALRDSGAIPERNDDAATIENQSTGCQDDKPGDPLSGIPYLGDPF